MRRSLRFVFLSLALFGAVASAKTGFRGKPQDFVPTEMTEQEREAARVRARYKMSVFQEPEDTPKEVKFPWMQLGFTLLTFAVVSPFAWSSYKRMVGETVVPEKPRRRITRHNNAAE